MSFLNLNFYCTIKILVNDWDHINTIPIFSHFHDLFIIDIESFEFQEIMITICNKMMVLKSNCICILNTYIHFKVRRRVHRKLTNINQYVIYLLHIGMYKQKEKIVHSCWESLWTTIYSYWNGIITIDKKISRGTQWAYCDLPSTFLHLPFGWICLQESFISPKHASHGLTCILGCKYNHCEDTLIIHYRIIISNIYDV